MITVFRLSMKPLSGCIPKSYRKVLSAVQTMQLLQLVPLTLGSRLSKALVQQTPDDEEQVWHCLEGIPKIMWMLFYRVQGYCVKIDKYLSKCYVTE